MSNYTITVHNLIENNFDFGLTSYPIFNESYRPVLNHVILEYYRFREIGWQNTEVFKQKLNLRMEMIMRGKYNDLYKAKAIEFNPRYNVEMHETFSHTVEHNNTATTNTSGETNGTSDINSENAVIVATTAGALNLNSNFPSEEMTVGNLTDNVFVSNAQKNSGTENVTNDSTNVSNAVDNQVSTMEAAEAQQGTTTETYTKFTEGSSAGLPFSRAMIQLKDYLDEFQLDQLICEELNDLFINVW